MGQLLGRPNAPIQEDNAARAACVTLSMVEAHGGFDGVRYRRVIRDLTSASNPHRDLFPETYRAMMLVCATMRQRGGLGELR